MEVLIDFAREFCVKTASGIFCNEVRQYLVFGGILGVL